MKKFKELQKGDVVWSIRKSYIGEGIHKLTVLGSWENSSMNDWKIEVMGDERVFFIFIPRSSFSKSFSSQLYQIYATTEEELLRVSKKFILKRVETIDKKIVNTKEMISYYEGLREKLDKLLIQIENE